MRVGELSDDCHDLLSGGQRRKRKAPHDDEDREPRVRDDGPQRLSLQWQDALGERHDFEECESLEVLGCLITASTLDAVRHRLARAEVAFWSNRSFFCSTLIS